MFTSLLRPKVDLASLVIRWGLAAVFLVHGYFKLVQNFPLRAELNMTEQTIVGWAEIAIGAAMALGLLARIAALAGITHQVIIIVMVTGKLALAGFDMTRGAPITRGSARNSTLSSSPCSLASSSSAAACFPSTVWSCAC